MSRRTATAAALLTAMLTLTTACTSDKPEPTPTPTPTATTSKPATPKDQAIADATKALDRYFDVTNKMRNDPNIPMDRLKTVAISVGLSYAQAEIAGYRSRPDVTSAGEATYEVNKILEVSLDNSAPQQGRVPTVQMQVCLDLSDVTAVDKNGASQVNPERMDRSIATFFVSNYDYAKDPRNGWKVSSDESKMEREC